MTDLGTIRAELDSKLECSLKQATAADQIREITRLIEAVRDDAEAAHIAEDYLRAIVLASIADGILTGAAVRACCELVLKTSEIDFPRWCS